MAPKGSTEAAIDGILLVDKSRGPTSHDVVAKVRRALRQRSVGHAGTLDPMATGLLVIGVGEGTKLLAALTDDDKAYEATLKLGVETDTLDAEGKVVAEAEVSVLDVATVQTAADSFLGAHDQIAPVYSAIKRDGRSLHELARKGEAVEAPSRQVMLRSVVVHTVSGDEVTLSLECGKGFYVRSFARDLAAKLGTLAHLTALRRTKSGGHAVHGALPFVALLGADAPELARARVVSMVDGVGTLPVVVLADRGLVDARHGRPVRVEDAPTSETFEEGRRVALVTDDRKLVALAHRDGAVVRIDRGFVEGQKMPEKKAAETVAEGAPCIE